MTFIKIDKNYLINKKVKNSYRLFYDHSDSNTKNKNNNFNTKSILFKSQELNRTDLSFLNLNDNQNALLNEFIRIFDNSDILINQQNRYASFYFETKDRIENDLGFSINEHIKNYNFNYENNIERITIKNLIDSPDMNKVLFIKDKIYKYYEDMSRDYYPNLEYGFCNYHSLNFYSQNINEKKHSNCLIYSNQISNNNNDIRFDNDFCFNFWLNVRKNEENKRSCIMHIPDIVTIYSIEYQEDYRLCFTFGQKAKLLFNLDNFPNIDLSNSQSQYADDCYLTASNHFSYNNWYNINTNFSLNDASNNEYLLSVYKDSTLIDNNTFININREKNTLFNSYVCIGNKPNYYKTDSNSYNTEYDKIFYLFFGKNYNIENSIRGSYFIKDLNLGLSGYSDEPDNGLNIEDFINNDEDIVFSEDIEISSSMNGEIHDIKIYGRCISENDINRLSKNSIENLEEEILNKDLQFYIPNFYLPLEVKKEGLFNNRITDLNLLYNNFYNPYYANTCGGLDMSIENFVVDFVKGKKPNLVIDGNDVRNIHRNFFESVLEDNISDTNNFDDFQNGIFTYDILSNITENNISSVVLNNGNINYKNMLLLPNDNGIPNIYFDVVNQALTHVNALYNINIDFYKNNFHNISCKDVTNISDFYTKFFNRLSGLNSGGLPNFNYKKQNIQGFFRNEYSLDTLSNISFFIENNDHNVTQISDFFDYNITNSYLFNGYSDNNNPRANGIGKQIQRFLTSNPITLSNPVTRLYNDSNLNITNAPSETIENVIYKKLPIPFSDYNKFYDSLFTTAYSMPCIYTNAGIKKGSLKIIDSNIITTNNNIQIELKDNEKGFIYRNDCLTKVAKWNYVGHAFYKEGIINILNPFLYLHGKNNYVFDSFVYGYGYVQETNLPIYSGSINKSDNPTYNSELRLDESSFNSDESFVYITDVNIHDEDLNVVAKAKFAHPIAKKDSDNIMIRLRMDY